MTYSEKLKDPRWQKKRLEIFQRDEFECCFCSANDVTLHVHHLAYGKDPWDVPNEHLLTLCEDCHEGEHNNRQINEKLLLDTIRLKGLSYGALIALASAIHYMQIWHTEGVVFDVIEWMIRDPALMTEITERYFKRPKKAPQDPLIDDIPF